MKIKPINVLFIIYFVPLLMATDCGDCGCGDYKAYNIVYKGVDFSVWDTSSWEDWKNNITRKYNNGTEDNLDKLFNHWD